MDRREYLAVFSTGVAGLVAGCSDESIQTADPSSGEEQDGDPPAGSSDSTPTPNDRTYELGQEISYEAGDAELAFRPTEAMLRDAVVYANSGRISSRSPENSEYTFLTIGIGMRNTGSEPVRPPSDMVFILDGQQYDLRPFSVAGLEPYSGVTEVSPGASVSRTANFAIPVTDSDGRLVVDFGSYNDSLLAEWVIDLGNLDRESFDYSGIKVGQDVTMGAGNTFYSMEVADYTETQSYTYAGYGGGEATHESSAGNRFVLVDLNIENTGETTVYVPQQYDMRLLAGQSQFEVARYRNDQQRYEGGEIAPDVVREGEVLFEVPEGISSYDFEVNLTTDITASWSLD